MRPPVVSFALLVAPLAPLALLALSGCSHSEQVRVFVRDPRAVWVERSEPRDGESHVLLPRAPSANAQQFAEVPVPLNFPAFSSLSQRASVIREANGGITIDYPACAISPYAALHSSGELTVTSDHGSDVSDIVGSDGPNLRVAYRCHTRNAGHVLLDLTLVTPWSNVREIHEYGN
jgi:hypothetical protein